MIKLLQRWHWIHTWPRWIIHAYSESGTIVQKRTCAVCGKIETRWI